MELFTFNLDPSEICLHNNIVTVLFLGQQALYKRSNPTINVVVYFHTEQIAKTAKILKRLGTTFQSLPREWAQEVSAFVTIPPPLFRHCPGVTDLELTNKVTSDIICTVVDRKPNLPDSLRNFAGKVLHKNVKRLFNINSLKFQLLSVQCFSWVKELRPFPITLWLPPLSSMSASGILLNAYTRISKVILTLVDHAVGHTVRI